MEDPVYEPGPQARLAVRYAAALKEAYALARRLPKSLEHHQRLAGGKLRYGDCRLMLAVRDSLRDAAALLRLRADCEKRRSASGSEEVLP